MNLYAALMYWVVVLLWLSVLLALWRAFLRHPSAFGATRLLLFVVVIDATRSVIENTYFGVHFGAHFGFFDADLTSILGSPHWLLIPKLINASAAISVLLLLGLRWAPAASDEYSTAQSQLTQAGNERVLTRLAHFDTLTQLPNRITFRKALQRMLEQAPRQPGAIAIALFDLDGFRRINDTLGHSVGDDLLRKVAETMRGSLRSEDRLYRLGDDEFVMLVRDFADEAQAQSLVQGVLRSLEVPIELACQVLHIGVSVGIAIDEDGATVDGMMANANLALSQAKSAGGRRCSMYRAVLRDRAESRLKLEQELDQAFSNGEFVLFYQPQVRSRDGMLMGVEALLRWQHPRRGLLCPGDFISVLAQMPISEKVGRWILTTACRDASELMARGSPPFRIGVNLVQSQLTDADLPAEVRRALDVSGLDAELLELEITEDIALGQHDGVVTAALQVRSMGVGLAFDDFGTGYASLSYLTRFPLTRIKLDRTFIAQIDRESESAIVETMIELGHHLGLAVTAEGVESARQLQFLLNRGCDEVQGYLFAKPMPRQELETYLLLEQVQMGRSSYEVAAGLSRRPESVT